MMKKLKQRHRADVFFEVREHAVAMLTTQDYNKQLRERVSQAWTSLKYPRGVAPLISAYSEYTDSTDIKLIKINWAKQEDEEKDTICTVVAKDYYTKGVHTWEIKCQPYGEIDTTIGIASSDTVPLKDDNESKEVSLPSIIGFTTKFPYTGALRIESRSYAVTIFGGRQEGLADYHFITQYDTYTILCELDMNAKKVRWFHCDRWSSYHALDKSKTGSYILWMTTQCSSEKIPQPPQIIEVTHSA